MVGLLGKPGTVYLEIPTSYIFLVALKIPCKEYTKCNSVKSLLDCSQTLIPRYFF